jgi:hypothetical protein
MTHEAFQKHEVICGVPINKKGPSLKQNDSVNSDDEEEEPINNNRNVIDDIPSNINGKYVCQICNKRYTSEYNLGEHFTITHANYESQLVLDNKKTSGGFPGLKILEDIGMIKHVELKEHLSNNYYKNDCLLCSIPYVQNINKNITSTLKKNSIVFPKIHNEPLKPIDMDLTKIFKPKEKKVKRFCSCGHCKFPEDDVIEEKISKSNIQYNLDELDNLDESDELDESDSSDDESTSWYYSERKYKYISQECYSDSEVDILKKNRNIVKKSIKSKCDLDLIRENVIEINDQNLQNLMAYYDNLDKQIAKLQCCNTIICTDCLEKYIMEKNDIICPFCMFDHNKRDQNYVKYNDIDTCNKNAWKKWWKRHLDILEKNIF